MILDNGRTVPRPAGVQDTASQFVELTQRFATGREKLEVGHSVTLWLARPGCVVRNCLFINGAEGAVRLTASQTIENCIFFNHYKNAVKIERGFTPERRITLPRVRSYPATTE